jgi:tetratricopeptide (TPR) repeat protein
VAIALTVARGKPLKSRILPVLGAVSILMAGVYAGCSPVWIHNYFIAKDRVLLSAHDGINLYLGNHPDSNGYTSIPKGLRASQEGLLTDSQTIPETALGRPLKRSEISAFWKKKAAAFRSEHPVAWMRLLARKFANFWNAFQYDDLSILKLLRDEHATPPGLRFGFAAALGLPGLLFCWRRWPRSRWVAGAVLLHMAALLPVFITERYRLAASPGLLLLGAGGLWLLWENLSGLLLKNTRSPGQPLDVGRSSSQLPTLITQLALTIACAWWVSVPQADIGLWSLDFYKAGIRATDGAESAIAHAKHASDAKDDRQSARLVAASTAYLANAQRNLETAFAYVPHNAEITFALGNVWFHRHDFARAKACYGEALRLTFQTSRPHDGALRNMGIIALEEKQWSEAENFLTAALKVEPGSAKAYFLIARARRESGNVPGALAAIGEAIRLDGKTPEFQKLRDELRAAAPVPK